MVSLHRLVFIHRKAFRWKRDNLSDWRLTVCENAWKWLIFLDSDLNFVFLADGNETASETNVDKLKRDLLKSYNKYTRPEQYNTATFCELSMTLIHIDLDETRGVLTSHAWLKMNWSDSKLSWDNNSYGMNDLHVAADEVHISPPFWLIGCFASLICFLLPIRFGNLTWAFTIVQSLALSSTTRKPIKSFTAQVMFYG